MSEQINVVAILSPTQGKEDRVIELLKEMILKVGKEPGVIQYDCFVEKKTGDVVFIEKYDNKAALTAHMSTSYFSNFGKSAEAEGLLTKAPELKFLSHVSGLNL